MVYGPTSSLSPGTLVQHRHLSPVLELLMEYKITLYFIVILRWCIHNKMWEILLYDCQLSVMKITSIRACFLLIFFFLAAQNLGTSFHWSTGSLPNCLQIAEVEPRMRLGARISFQMSHVGGWSPNIWATPWPPRTCICRKLVPWAEAELKHGHSNVRREVLIFWPNICLSAYIKWESLRFYFSLKYHFW